MSRLLEDLLATARKRSAAFVDREVDLTEVARQVVEEYRLLGAERSLRFDLRLAPGPVVYADPAALDRALSNVVSNGVRLAPVGSAITVAVGSRQGWAWVAVRDVGPGIAEEHRTRVFDRFSRGASEPRAEQTSGSGLGLYIARRSPRARRPAGAGRRGRCGQHLCVSGSPSAPSGAHRSVPTPRHGRNPLVNSSDPCVIRPKRLRRRADCDRARRDAYRRSRNQFCRRR